jgi:hypothetical protein
VVLVQLRDLGQLRPRSERDELTFDLSRSAFASLVLPRTAAYPLELLLSSAVSLAVAELWNHRSGSPSSNQATRSSFGRVTSDMISPRNGSAHGRHRPASS